MVYSKRRFVVCLTLCHFVLVFFSPFSIAITSLGEERANFSVFRTFVRFVWICRFPLPIGVWEGLRFVIVFFSYLFFVIVALPEFFSHLFSIVYAFSYSFVYQHRKQKYIYTLLTLKLDKIITRDRSKQQTRRIKYFSSKKTFIFPFNCHKDCDILCHNALGEGRKVVVNLD